jgi:hypothetical protein
VLRDQDKDLYDHNSWEGDRDVICKQLERAERAYDVTVSCGYDGILRGDGGFKMRKADWGTSLVIIALAVGLHIPWLWVI